MISNTWRITEMIYMPNKTINYYVCCAMNYNMSDSKIHYNNRFYTLCVISRIGLGLGCIIAFATALACMRRHFVSGDGVLQFNR